MASSGANILLLIAHFALCSCIEWNGPASTTALGDSSTDISRVPKQSILRRQTSHLSICGYESGRAQSTIACNAGFSCGVSAIIVLSSTSLVQDCCTTSVSLYSAFGFLSATSCLVYTSCVDFPATVTGNPDILTCLSNAPYCQSFTYPELNATGHGCDIISETTWRTVSLGASPAIQTLTPSIRPSVTTTSPFATTLTAGQPPHSVSSSSSGSGNCGNDNSNCGSGNGNSSNGTGSSPGPIQDLNLAQKLGIGIGCGCAFLFITIGIISRIRRHGRGSNDLASSMPKISLAHQVPTMSNEKPPADQVVDVQGQDSITEEE